MQQFLSLSYYQHIPSRQKFLLFKTNVAGLWLIALIAPRDCVFCNQHMHRVRLDSQPLRDLCTEWCYLFKHLTCQFVLVRKNDSCYALPLSCTHNRSLIFSETVLLRSIYSTRTKNFLIKFIGASNNFNWITLCLGECLIQSGSESFACPLRWPKVCVCLFVCLYIKLCLLLHVSVTIWYDMIWYDMIWYDMVWYDMVWYGMIWYGMIRYDMIWYDMVWYDIIWYDMLWYDMICYDMICYDMIWYDMVWYDMIWYDMIWYGMIYDMIWYI